MDALELRDLVLAVLAPIAADVTENEPRIDDDGRIRPTVILSVSTGVASNRRAAGGSVNRDGYVNALVVTPSRDSCLWLTETTRDALADMPLPGGARLTDVSYDGEPTPEPGTDAARWSRALTLTATRKRGR